MANVTLTQVSATLKEVYEPRIEEQYSDEVVFGKRIEKTSDGISDMIGGKYLDFAIERARNPGISYRAEGEALGNPGALPYAEVHVPVFAGYGRTRFTGHVMKLAQTNTQAFAAMAQRNMDSLKKAAVKDAGRIYYGDGTGRLATVSTGSGGGTNTLTVLNAEGYNVTVGMEIDVLEHASPSTALVTGREVTLVVPGATETVITFSGATATSTTAHAIYRAGNYTSGTQREPTGMGKISAATGVLHTLDPATTPVWKGNATALGGAITEAAMGLKCDQARVNGGKTSAIFCSLGVRRAYVGVLRASRQFHNTVEFDGGYKAIGFHNGDEIPVIDDVDCPRGTMHFTDESSLSIRQAEGWKFIDDMGSMFEKVSGYDLYDVTIRSFWELCTYQRNANGVLTTITEA